MALRKYATWTIISAFRHVPCRALSAFQHGSSAALSAIQLVIPSAFEGERVRDAGGHAKVYLSVIPARAGIHCGTRSAPDHLGTVLVPAFTSVLFTAEGVHHQLEVLWAAGDPDGFLVVHSILFDQFQQGLIEGLHAIVLAL